MRLLGLESFKKASPTLRNYSLFSKMVIMIVMICLVGKALACEVRRPGSSSHSALYSLRDFEGGTLTL